ncbi:MAG: hypothetical protein AAF321_01100, partial [Pseudomonadota bacterium]
LAEAHVVLLVFAGEVEEGEPVAADDALEAAFVHRDALARLPTTPHLASLIKTAQTALSQAYSRREN